MRHPSIVNVHTKNLTIPAGSMRTINIDRIKHIPQVTAVKPVLPPAATPAPLSTNDVTVLVPMIAPTTVPTESANKAFSIFSILPFSSTKPILFPTATSVPAVSKKSTNKKFWRQCGEKGTCLHCWWECN